MKRLVVLGVLTSAAVALAMPTKDELKKAQPLVAELMAPTLADFKAKKKTAAEVGDVSVDFAAKAETEAAKFLLLKGALTYYVRGDEYDKAADAVETLKSSVAQIPPRDDFRGHIQGGGEGHRKDGPEAFRVVSPGENAIRRGNGRERVRRATQGQAGQSRPAS